MNKRWLAVSILLAIVACGPADAPQRFYDEDFEELCDGVPCGWERTSGAADQATWIETIHPGEHGLRLEGEVSVRGPGTEVGETIDSSVLFVRAYVRCDLDSELRLDVVIADDFGGTYDASALLSPAETWEAPYEAALEGDAPTLPGNAVHVVAVGLAKTGPGTCEISELIIDTTELSPGC